MQENNSNLRTCESASSSTHIKSQLLERTADNDRINENKSALSMRRVKES